MYVEHSAPGHGVYSGGRNELSAHMSRGLSTERYAWPRPHGEGKDAGSASGGSGPPLLRQSPSDIAPSTAGGSQECDCRCPVSQGLRATRGVGTAPFTSPSHIRSVGAANSRFFRDKTQQAPPSLCVPNARRHGVANGCPFPGLVGTGPGIRVCRRVQ